MIGRSSSKDPKICPSPQLVLVHLSILSASRAGGGNNLIPFTFALSISICMSYMYNYTEVKDICYSLL